MQESFSKLQSFPRRVVGADGSPLPIYGQTKPVKIQWGSVVGNSRFLTQKGLQKVAGIIGMDILETMKVQIDAAAYVATPHDPTIQVMQASTPLRPTSAVATPAPHVLQVRLPPTEIGRGELGDQVLELAAATILRPCATRCVKIQLAIGIMATTIFSPSTELPEQVMSLHSISQGSHAIVHLANFDNEEITLKRQYVAGTGRGGRDRPRPHPNDKGSTTPTRQATRGRPGRSTCRTRQCAETVGPVSRNFFTAHR